MLATVELSPDQVRRFAVEGQKNGPRGRLIAPPTSLKSSTGGPFGGLESPQILLQEVSAPLRRHKLEAGRPGSPDYAALEVPLHVGFVGHSGMWLWTPEDLRRGFRLCLYVEEASTAHLNVGLEPAGLPVAEAYANARFLYALHAGSGRLVFTMPESRRESIAVAELPLLRDPEALARIEAQLRFLGDLVAVDEATGTGLVYPQEPDAEDARGARRAAEAVRKGWISEPVENVRLVLTAEGARSLPLNQGPEAVMTLAIEDDGPWERLLGRRLDLGPRVHWIEHALLAPGEAKKLRGWLAEGPESPKKEIEVVLVPDGDSPMHVFFAEWPKPSLERVRREIEAFEERYGMISDEFNAAWEADNEDARRVEDGEAWMSLLGAREALKCGRLP